MKTYDKEVLRKLQLTELEILKEIKRICEKHSLKYYLIGGTLLGAIRHKGFIPWDDDIDIALPRADYEKFCEICQGSELDEKYHLDSIYTNDKCLYSYSKIRKRDTLFNEQSIAHLDIPKGIFVDVFPLDFAKSEKSKIKAFRSLRIKQIDSYVFQKYEVIKSNALKSIIRSVWFLSASPNKLKKRQQQLMQKVKQGNFYVNYGSCYHHVKETMPCDYYGDGVQMEFEGEFFTVPKEYEKVLIKIYGTTWSQLPPEEKRVTHSPLEIKFDLNKDI